MEFGVPKTTLKDRIAGRVILVSQARPLPTPYRYAGEGKGLDKCYSTFRSSGI